jgi:hypothetical protein
MVRHDVSVDVDAHPDPRIRPDFSQVVTTDADAAM